MMCAVQPDLDVGSGMFWELDIRYGLRALKAVYSPHRISN